MDIRLGQKDLAFYGKNGIDRVRGLKIKGQDLSSLCEIERQKRPSKINRKDGNAAAFWTVEIETDKSDKAFKEAASALAGMTLPDGYFFDFQREYKNLNKDYAKIFALFCACVFAIYVFIGAQCERPLDALKALLLIPMSLFLPLGLRALFMQPLALGDAVGMVYVSGLCVNNAIFIMNEFNLKKRKDARAAAKALLKSMLSSSATTVAGAVPVMICGSASFASDLAFFTLFGTLGSLAASLFVFPFMLSEK